MITEDYCDFETAKLLKEKEFDEYCFCINHPLPEGEYHKIILPNLLNNSIIPFTDEYKFCRYKENFITIPTLQMAMKWLRELHNIHIVVNVDVSSPSFFIDINKKDYDGWVSANDDTSMVYSGETIFTKTFRKYEEACEAAIKYCLEHLI